VLAPGGLAVLYGIALSKSTALATLPLPTELAGTSVELNGTPVPLLYVSPGQVDFQVPWEATPGKSSIRVRIGDTVTATEPVTIATYAPGVFSADQSGSGQALIYIAGANVMAAPTGAFPGSRPVKRGEYIAIFAIGLGPVTNPPATGAAPADLSSLMNPAPIVSVGGLSTIGTIIPYVMPAPIFAGLIPGAVGVYQINVQVPQIAASGDAVPIRVVVGCVNVFTCTNPAPANVVTIAVE
jgi:uncharacterized protein (TIGR03437 family)